MDRSAVVKWLRANPDVDVTALACEAKAEWGCVVLSGRAVSAQHLDDGNIRAVITEDGACGSHIYLKPDDAAAFARHILELVKQ